MISTSSTWVPGLFGNEEIECESLTLQSNHKETKEPITFTYKMYLLKSCFEIDRQKSLQDIMSLYKGVTEDNRMKVVEDKDGFVHFMQAQLL